MAWEWSHTNEAYENARANLHDLPLKDLITILAEWLAHEPDEDGDEGFKEDVYLLEHERLTREYREGECVMEDLEDQIWERMSEQATCDNGGFNAWCCPFGCHTVSFDRKEEES